MISILSTKVKVMKNIELNNTVKKKRAYLGDSIVSLRTYGELKIHLTMNKISNLEPLKNSKIIS